MEGVIVSRFKYTDFHERVLLLNISAPTEDMQLYQTLDFLDQTLLEAEDARKAGNLAAEREEAKNAVTAAKAALEQFGVLGLEEPKELVEIFRELVSRRNELDPVQSPNRSR